MSRLLSSISALSWTRLHSHPDIPFSPPLHWPKAFLSVGLLPCFDLAHPVIPSWGKGSLWEVNVTTCMSEKHLPAHLRSVGHKTASGYNFPWEIWRHSFHIVSGVQRCYWEIRHHANSWAFVYQSYFFLSLKTFTLFQVFGKFLTMCVGGDWFFIFYTVDWSLPPTCFFP